MMNITKNLLIWLLKKGIIGINGHRSVGGIRVSLFNSIDDHMFDYFMKYFQNYVRGIK